MWNNSKHKSFLNNLLLYSLHNTPKHLCPHLITMSSSLKKSKEVILKKYLKLCIFDRLDSSCTRLVRNESNLTEEWSRLKYCKLLPSSDNSYRSTIYIVCTSIRLISYRDYYFSSFTELSLTHKKKKWDFCFRKTIENIEIGYVWHKELFKIPLY